jgi:hypothetical protein
LVASVGTRNAAARLTRARDAGCLGAILDANRGVSITFAASTHAYESSPTAVTVAGHDAIYQELPVSANGTRTELWIVDIKDTRVTITLEARPGTTAAELAEAHAIIDSIHSERRKTRAGFRLTFTLPDGWDSG